MLHLSVISFTGSTNDLILKYQKNQLIFNIHWGELGNKKDQRTIGNLDVIWLEENITGTGGKEMSFKINNIIFTNGELGFLIHTQNNNIDELNKILSTFKLI